MLRDRPSSLGMSPPCPMPLQASAQQAHRLFRAEVIVRGLGNPQSFRSCSHGWPSHVGPCGKATADCRGTRLGSDRSLSLSTNSARRVVYKAGIGSGPEQKSIKSCNRVRQTLLYYAVQMRPVCVGSRLSPSSLSFRVCAHTDGASLWQRSGIVIQGVVQRPVAQEFAVNQSLGNLPDKSGAVVKDFVAMNVAVLSQRQIQFLPGTG